MHPRQADFAECHRCECFHTRIQRLPREAGESVGGGMVTGSKGSTGALQIKAISGHAGPVPGRDAQREEAGGVCKYIDVTTCIGCKACEVAWVEWNRYPFQDTTFDNTYQTMPDTRWNYFNLIRVNEHQFPDRTFGWLISQDPCMH